MRSTRLAVAGTTIVLAALALGVVPSIASTPSRVPGKVLGVKTATLRGSHVTIRVYVSRVTHGSAASLHLTSYVHRPGKRFSFSASLKVPYAAYPDSRISDFQLYNTPSDSGSGYSRYILGGTLAWYPHASSTDTVTHYFTASFHGVRLHFDS